MISDKQFIKLKEGDCVFTLRYGKGKVISHNGRSLTLKTDKRPNGCNRFFQSEIQSVIK